MKLLYTLTSYAPAVGGAQIHQHLLAQHIQKEHSVEVISQWNSNRTDWLLGTTLKAPRQSISYSTDGISVERMGLPLLEKIKLAPFIPIYYPLMGVSLPIIADTLEKHLLPKAKEANLIHNVRIGREGLTAASLKVARCRDIPFVLTPVHHPRWVGWRYRHYLNLYRQADGIFALTQSEKQILVGLRVDPEKIFVIGHGPVVSETHDAVSFKTKYSIADGPIVLFLGQYHEYKGYRHLLESAKLVWEDHPDTQFVFVGPAVGGSEKVFAAYKDPRIHRLGKISLQDKTDALAACTLLCVPSSQESFGGVYTEAWMLGKPVIGCDIPAVAEVIDDEVNGFLVRQHSSMVARRIQDLLNDPELASSMGAAGRRKVQQIYTWPIIAKKAIAAYRTVLS